MNVSCSVADLFVDQNPLELLALERLQGTTTPGKCEHLGWGTRDFLSKILGERTPKLKKIFDYTIH